MYCAYPLQMHNWGFFYLFFLITCVWIKISEKEVDLILLPNDAGLVKSMIHELERTYEENTGLNVKINIDKSLTLPAQEVCGIWITAKNRTIVVKNTLVERLLRLTQEAMPFITNGLFGKNPTRTRTITPQNSCGFL